jgi:cAMP-dependent protein kinase regulator
MFPDLSDSDSDEDDSRALELLERRRTSKWYAQRRGICGEVFGSHHLWEDYEVPAVQRKSTVNSRILFRLKSLFLFKDFDDQDINRIIAAMAEISCPQGVLIANEGKNEGDMFVIDSGELEIVKDFEGESAIIKILKEGEMFGEMSMLYNMPRWASVRTRTASVLFKLDRRSYYCLINERNLRKRKIFQSALAKVEVLKELEPEEKYKLEDLVKEIPIHLNQYVVREGKLNKSFYIVESGKFIALKKEKNGHEKILSEFKEGDVFGENCLYSKLPPPESIMSLVRVPLCRPTGSCWQSRRMAWKECSAPLQKS